MNQGKLNKVQNVIKKNILKLTLLLQYFIIELNYTRV